MEGQLSYQDFDLLIEPGTRGRYRARVLRSPAGESASVEFKVPFSPVELENFALKLGRPRRGTRGPGRPETAPLKNFGGKLYRAVFQDELRGLGAARISCSSVDRLAVQASRPVSRAPARPPNASAIACSTVCKPQVRRP